MRRDRAALIQKAFDAAASLPAVETQDALNKAVADSFAAMGFTTFVALDMDARGQLLQPLFGANHTEWRARYSEQQHRRHDAVLPVARQRLEPFFWSETERLTTITPRAKLIFDEARAFGLNEGFLAPIHGPGGQLTTVLLAGEKIDAADPYLRTAAHLLALRFAQVGHKLLATGLAGAQRPVLTARQIECLRWVREGKSAADIGEILGLSSRTVEAYIAAACARLGVRTRFQAVIEAAGRGLLAL